MDKTLSKKQRKKLKKQEKLEQKQLQSKKKIQRIENERKKSKALDDDDQPQKRKKSFQSPVQKPSQSKEQETKQKQNNKKEAKKQKIKQKAEKESEEQQEQENGNENQELDFNNVMEDQQNMEFSFLVAEINEKHYHSMKTILEKFARLTGVMSSDWADAIVANGKAGNVIIAEQAESSQEQQQDEQQQQQQQQEDDEQNVCSGVINILPNSHKLTKKVLTKVSQTVQSQKIQGPAKASQISQILSSNSCSLLICERAINLPAFIVKSMYEVLKGDLETLKTDNNKEYSNIYGKYILGVSEVQVQKQHKNKGSTETTDIDSIIFSRFEDYLFAQNSQGWWVGQSSPNAVRKVPLHRFYYVISTNKYFEAVDQIGSLLEQN